MRYLPLALAGSLAFSAPAAADPTIGIGLSVAFGSGGVDTGVGLRVFSDDRRDKAVASIGLDYMFGSQSFRGTIGAAYLSRDVFAGVDLGYNFNRAEFDFGGVVGAANTKRRSSDDDNGLPPGDDIGNGPGDGPPPEVGLAGGQGLEF